jgi:apolipoprotein N-acyltransferase
MYDQTREAARAGARLIVWPEGALGVDLRKARTDEVRALARETGAYLVVGHAVQTDRGLQNEATVVSPEGEILGTFGKDHPLVFFGESSVTRGSYPTYETEMGRLATIICYDLVFTDTARAMAAGGAGLIAVPSNDWPGIVHKQYTFLAFRAVENRVALVKADRGYDSIVVRATGEIVAAALSPTPRQAILYADVAPGLGDSLYVRLGDLVGWLCLASIPAFIAVSHASARERREPQAGVG